jgi:NDP-sugar pyrophosphorylase family protein
MSKKAVILAGGKGTRLRPYTVALPKPLMPVGEYPILEVIIRQLAHQGFSHITLAVNHQAELINAFFQDGRRWGIQIAYSLEDRPLGTMAPLRLVRDLPDDFLVMNGDILTDLDYSAFFDNHVARGNIFTVSSYAREHKVDYGVLMPDDAGFLAGFQEKPVSRYLVSMGIYMVSQRALQFIPEGKAYGFDNLMIDLIKAGKPAAIAEFNGYWLDIGRPDDYEQAVEQFEKMKAKFIHE